MNRAALLRTIQMTRELEARGVKPAEEDGGDDVTGILDMNTWGYAYTCGTVGCLAGWMTLDPQLREMGLQNESDLAPNRHHGRRHGDLRPYHDSGLVSGSGDEAMQGFLEVSQGVVDYLFSSRNENSWEAARERLENVLEGRA